MRAVTVSAGICSRPKEVNPWQICANSGYGTETLKREPWRGAGRQKGIKICPFFNTDDVLERITLGKVWPLCGDCCTSREGLFVQGFPGGFSDTSVAFQAGVLCLALNPGANAFCLNFIPCQCLSESGVREEQVREDWKKSLFPVLCYVVSFFHVHQL